MNVNSGGLSFDFSATNDQLRRIVQESKDDIAGLADASKRGGKEMDAAFKDAFDRIEQGAQKADVAISQQTQAIIKLQAEIKSLRSEAGAAFEKGDVGASAAIMEVVRAKEREIQKRNEAKEACYEALTVLDQERQRLDGLRQSAESAAGSQQSLRAQLRQVREQLAQMEATQGVGVRQTEQFRKLQQEAGRLADALADAQAQVRIFSDDNAQVTGLITGFNGLMGAVSAAQGALNLFGVENDKVQQAMLKVQSAMAITTGLQQVLNTVNKDSAFMLTTVRKAKDLLTAANTRLSVALGISTVAAKALMATLTLGLSVAITAVIALWDKFSSKADEAKESTNAAKEAFEAYHKSMASKSADLVGKYQKLRQEYSLLKSEAEKTQWIKDNANEFSNLELSVNNVTDADNVFIRNTQNVIKALELRAKALALQDMQMKAYQAYYDKLIAADQSVAGGGFYNAVKAGSRIQFNNSQLDKDLQAAMIAAGATRNGSAYNDGSWYTMDRSEGVLTQKAIDAINAYRVSQARATNTRIHNEAQAELDKVVDYTKQQLALTENEIKALGILQKKHNTGGGSGGNGGGRGSGSGTGTQNEDPFKKELDTRKALYEKYLAWITSSDATVREAAASEFAPLLAEGETYLAYLEKERDAIQTKATKTATDLKNLSTLNDEIAQATKDATIRNFQTELNDELQQCETLGAMLDAIAKRRQEIESDSTDVGNKERDILNEAETDTKKQMADELQQLLSDYASYEAERLNFAATYARKRELLERAVREATSDEQRAAAERALIALEDENQKWSRAKTALYAELLDTYKSHEEQIAAIQKKYSSQRREAEAAGNVAMLQMINAQEQSELSKLAASRLMASESWSQLFSDTSRLATTTINRLIKEVEAQKLTLSAQMNPADLKAIEDQLERARQEISKRNPFLALRDSLADLRQAMQEKKLLGNTEDEVVKELDAVKKQYDTIKAWLADDELKAKVSVEFANTLSGGADFIDYLKRRIASLQGEKIKLGAEFTGQHELDVLIAMLNKTQGTGKSVGQSLKDTFSDVGSSIDFVAGCFNSVVNGMKTMGISMDEETEAILNDIGGILDGASQLSQGIATGNPLGIIQGSIGLLSSAFSLFNSRDRKAEKAIKRHQEALSKLKNTYKELEDAVNRALGEEVYKNQTSLINNLRQQQTELSGMIAAEQSKKKTDKGKIEEWGEQYAELGRQIMDIMEDITQSITQTTAKDLAGNLADALVEAFEGGEDAAKAFGEVADDVIKKAVINALKLQLLEKPLQAAIKQLQKDMGFDEEGNGSFDGLTEAEQRRFKDAVEKAGANFQAAMDMYKGLFDQLDDSDPTTLSGAIKGANQESIDLLAGQTNAVRQNQVVSLGLMRQQLLTLSNIESNTGVMAARLLSILNAITSPQGGSLRSQGLTD